MKALLLLLNLSSSVLHWSSSSGVTTRPRLLSASSQMASFMLRLMLLSMLQLLPRVRGSTTSSRGDMVCVEVTEANCLTFAF